MAKINALPSLEVINTLKGTLDYYYWKGIPCVRKWPHIPHSSRTQASLASAHLFGQIVQGWALVGGMVKDLYTQAAADQPRTGRDLYVSGVLGGQHEASMSDFLDLLTAIAESTSNLEALLNALGSENTDDLQIDIKSALTTLPVKGEDQLFSFKDTYAQYWHPGLSGANGHIDSTPVPEGEVWEITTVTAQNRDRASTQITFYVKRADGSYIFADELRAFAPAEIMDWSGRVFLKQDDFIRIIFVGGAGADDCRGYALGYTITKET